MLSMRINGVDGKDGRDGIPGAIGPFCLMGMELLGLRVRHKFVHKKKILAKIAKMEQVDHQV